MKNTSPQILAYSQSFLSLTHFAGLHKQEDPKELVLFDVENHNGIVPPEQFVEDFGDLNIAQVIYQGKLTGKFVDDVRQGEYNVDEGVVCKGISKATNSLWMVKIKTYVYRENFKQAFQDNWENYWE